MSVIESVRIETVKKHTMSDFKKLLETTIEFTGDQAKIEFTKLSKIIQKEIKELELKLEFMNKNHEEDLHPYTRIKGEMHDLEYKNNFLDIVRHQPYKLKFTNFYEGDKIGSRKTFTERVNSNLYGEDAA